jgi:hypothetical protein
MNTTLILAPIFNMLWYLIPIALLAAVINSSWFKGLIGEFQVNLLLKLFLPKNKYHLIKNATLPTEDGTTQIDHILISKFGIFVIETKNMKGWIFGSEHQKEWTQKIYKHSNKFQNPLRQNYKHLKTLESYLNINQTALFSIIVFIGDSTFKTDMPANVTYAGGCIRYIKSKSIELFTDAQVEEIISTIENARLERNFKTNREHIAHVKQIVAAKSDEKICPKCGSVMMVREAKQGQYMGNKFWGCSAFPKCRTTIQIDLL